MEQPTPLPWTLLASRDHPAAEFCVNLSIGGHTDWYLPARYELDIAYFKPQAKHWG
jgi:hypothetical protein